MKVSLLFLPGQSWNNGERVLNGAKDLQKHDTYCEEVQTLSGAGTDFQQRHT